MDLGINIGTSQRLEQTLSPQLLQSVNILQKTSLELETAIKDELESNPLLELDESVPDESRESDEYSENNEDNPADSGSDMRDVDDRDMDERYQDGDSLLDFNFDRFLENGNNDDAPFKDLNERSTDAEDEWDRPLKDVGKSLQDNLRDQLMLWSGTRELLEQLAECGCSERRFRALVEYLIDSVSEEGFLQGAGPEQAPIQLSHDEYINEIEAMLRAEQELDSCSIPVREAVHVLQGFNPKGIGARDQRECFLIQAYAMPGFPTLGIKILENCYEDLLALRYAKIGKSLGASTEEVQKAVASFARLNPHPGFQLSNARLQTISADLKIVEKKGRFTVEAVRSSLQKRLRINQTYKSILDDKNASKSDKDYVRTHLNKAVEFMKAVDNRYSTMELVMQAILKRQKAFFSQGPAFLKPMVLQDIADDVKRDVSTVNRVTNGKFVDTPFGVYELKRFFTSGVKQGSAPDAEEVGSAQIIDAIKKMIDEEDKKKPLSDQAISDKLAEQGVKVARRTVAKYRENNLHILTASQRKR